jgi:hypothetical protein
MKSVITIVVVLMIMVSVGFAQSKVDVGINAHLGIPMGDMSDRYDMGFGGGLVVMIPLSSTTTAITIGGSYESYGGKSQTTSGPGWWETTTYHAMGIVSFFVGPKFGKETGAYFLPAVSLNVMDEVRFGIDIGGGALIPVGSGPAKLNIGAKYSIANLIGGNEGELTVGGIRIVVGIVF